jgi:hypothetical protein
MHNIQNRDIQTGVEMAWHKLTNVVEQVKEENVGILYPMDIVQCYHSVPSGMAESNGRQIVSLDDCLPVGSVVGADYKLIPNREIWDEVQLALAGTGHKIVSAGTVGNRSTGFISVKVCESFQAARRLTNTALNILWGHGGNRSVSYRTGVTVVVCQNTLNLALRDKARVSIRHTRSANIGDLGREIDAHVGVTAEFRMAMDSLDSQPCSTPRAEALFAGFLGTKADSMGQTGQTKLKLSLGRLSRLHRHGAGNYGQTMADCFNAVTDYYSHESAGMVTPWKQYVASEFGTAGARKQEFFEAISTYEGQQELVARGKGVMASLGL